MDIKQNVFRRTETKNRQTFQAFSAYRFFPSMWLFTYFHSFFVTWLGGIATFLRYKIS